ncbi:hypothetical protein D3C75_1345020 [compost metagenome]
MGVAEVLARLERTQYSTGVNVPSVIQEARKLASGFRQIEGSAAIARPVPRTNGLEQLRVDSTRNGCPIHP